MKCRTLFFFFFFLLSSAFTGNIDVAAVEPSAAAAAPRLRALVRKTSLSSSSSSSAFKGDAAAAAAEAAQSAGLTWRTERELVEVQAWGVDSIRVTFTNGRGPIDSGALGAVLAKPELGPPPAPRTPLSRPSTNAARSRYPHASSSSSGTREEGFVTVEISPDGASGNVTNGGIRAVVAPVTACCSGGGAAGLQALGIVFVNASTGAEILREHYPLHGQPARVMHPVARGSGSLMSVAVSFAGYANERLFGLGQHQHGKLDQAGFVIELDQFNTEVR